MILAPFDQVSVNIVEAEQLPLFPRWQLYDIAILLGDFSSSDEYVELYRNTIGSSGEHSGSHEFRFNKTSLRLEALTLYTQFLHKSEKSALQAWQNSVKKTGLIHLAESLQFIDFFEFSPEDGDLPDMRYEYDQKANTLIMTTNESIMGNLGRLRLTIANDFELLFYDGVFCGWQLFHPTKYLIRDYEQPHSASWDVELPGLLLEYLELAAVAYSLASPAINPELHTRLNALRNRIQVDKGSMIQRQIIREAIDYLIDTTF